MDAGLCAPFYSASTYENAIETDVFPVTSHPLWILGIKYSLVHDRNHFEDDICSRLLFTYRKNFAPIGGNGPSSDLGWGCMLRCGQMMLAQALICRHLTRDWRWKRGRYDPKYFEILRLFHDKKDSCYSIHQIACMGQSEGKAVGEWFGPNTIMQVLRKLATYDRWSGLVIHIAMDNTVIIDDIRSLCVSNTSSEQFVEGCNVQSVILSAFLSTQHHLATQSSPVTTSHQVEPGHHTATTRHWKPLLLVIPLRLGLSDINPVYFTALKTCLTLRQSVGIIGGKPNHAHWFIGFTENRLYFLDPHVQQPFVDLSLPSGLVDESYHCECPSSIDISQLDPSIAVGFYCDTESDFTSLCASIRRLFMKPGILTPIFEVHDKRPSHLSLTGQLTPDTIAASSSDSTLSAADGLDEYEIL